ncbi:MAG: OmpH family outer membrane protein [Limisphaerales bacterium]
MILPAILLMTILSSSALAQTQFKIGTVNLKTLFDNYYKTKLAQADIQDQARQLDNDDKDMRASLTKANDDYQQLLEQSNDQALSADERNKRKQAAADKLAEIEKSKTALDQYERQAQTTLADKRQRMRKDILIDIKKFVNEKARAEGYSLIFDTAAETVNGTTAILYTNGQNDLTSDVLSRMNAGAPIDVTKPATTMTSPPPLTNSSNP